MGRRVGAWDASSAWLAEDESPLVAEMRGAGARGCGALGAGRGLA